MRRILVVAICSHLYFFSHLVSAQTDQEIPKGYLSNLLDQTPLFDTTRIRAPKAVVSIDAVSDAWKKWHTVQNYSFGKDRGSLPMIADLQALHPYFRDKVFELVRLCKAAGIRLSIVESYRTPSKQAEYYAMGKKYTGTPGGKSRHQYGVAVDVVPMVNSVAVWNNPRLWRKIGVIGEGLGLRWGGRWRVPYDPGHFEWSAGLSKEAREEGAIPAMPLGVIDQYPDLDAQLSLLQTYWNAWEVEQSMIANKGMATGRVEPEGGGVGK